MNKSFFVILIVFFFVDFHSFSQTQITNLKCEHVQNPIGLDETHPRFTWQIQSEKPGYLQDAFQLVVGTDEQEVASGTGNTWESGTANSSTIPAVYNGPDLQSFTRYFWSVRVKEKNGGWSDWSEAAFFETGLMDQTNWKGKWITDTHDYNVKPAPYFRKEFNAEKEIESARAYIAVAGLYELFINGERIGDHRLDPTYTRFDRRNLYVTYDITENLQ
ncbi:MAG: alpha-L-rhamnosidase N-terminal domain-containing protein, partial [Mariniphaga sp.]|nr:alpha-L-rhamnosidase N-terminal domain-containing protein [Mariniphaga sp.]